jgi:DMSO/TMAO reductase YedYZ molybdopterin-dependent catalytic subunit
MIIISAIPLGLVVIRIQSKTIITPNDEFFELHIGDVPTINVSNWILPIEGEIENPVIFTYENLTSLPTITINATLQSVSGNSGRAEWRGVPLKDVLELVRPTENAYDVVFYAADDYTSSLTIEEINSSEILLVFEMNRETLPANQGFPLRVVAPYYYGYKWVKWIVMGGTCNFTFNCTYIRRSINDDWFKVL